MKGECANPESDVGSSGFIKPDDEFNVSGADVLPSKVINDNIMKAEPPPENKKDKEGIEREHRKEGREEKDLTCDTSDISNSRLSTTESHHELQHERTVDSGIPSAVTGVLQPPNGNINWSNTSESPLKASENHGGARELNETNLLPDAKARSVSAEEAVPSVKSNLDDKLSIQKQQTAITGGLVNEMSGSHYRELLSNPASSSQISNSASTPKTTKKCFVGTKSEGSKFTSLLPDIGLHLNALAAAGGDKITGNKQSLTCRSHLISSPCTTSSFSPSEAVERPCDVQKVDAPQNGNVSDNSTVDECGVSESFPENKRRKSDSVGEPDSCKHCSCKKSKCLKLYCECFAAGIYCVQSCNCQDCFNKPSHVDTVLETRRLIESRNPLAFAPKVIIFSNSPKSANALNKTPASARYKRGCHCKRSGCLKKYCECFQVGVGCSLSCGCESCKNTFGRKQGIEGIVVEGGKISKECTLDVSSRDRFTKLDDENQAALEPSNNKSFTPVV